MNTISRLSPGLVGLPIVLLLPVLSASAHSYLSKSEPAANAQLASPPEHIRIWFTEAPELRLSDIQVVTPQRQRVDAGNLRLAPDNPELLILDMGEVPPGVYAVLWQVTSTVDGHTTKGVFAFTIGEQPPGAAQAALESLAISSPPPAPRPDDAAVRWLNLVGMSLVAGGLGFYYLVYRHVLKADATLQAQLPIARAGTHRIALLGIGLALVGTVLALLLQAAGIAGVSLLDPAALFESLARVVTVSRYGTVWNARMLILLVLLVLLVRMPMLEGQIEGVRTKKATGFVETLASRITIADLYWQVSLLLCGMLLLTGSLNSHSAATRTLQPLSTIMDWLHLGATAIWIGGLAQMVVTLPGVLARLPAHARIAALGSTVARFSPTGIICVAILVLTGIYVAWLQVGTLEGLWTTLYGQTLFVKLLMIVPLLVLAATNLFVVRPGLIHPPGRAAKKRQPVGSERLARLFRLATRGELLLALGLLLVVGVLTGLPPAREFSAGQTQFATLDLTSEREILTGRTSHFEMRLDIDPGGVGSNAFDIFVSDRNANAPGNLDRVILHFSYLDRDLGTQELELQSLSSRSYFAEGNYLSLVGRWRIDVLLRMKNGEDERVSYEVQVGEQTVRANRVVLPALQVGPAPARIGMPQQIRLVLQDQDGTVITDASVQLELQMPAHAHFEDATLRHSGGGVYTGSSVFTMSGNWIVVAKIFRSDGTGFERRWQFDVVD